MASTPSNPRLDLWLAMLAGDRVWRDEGAEPSSREQTVAAFMLVALTTSLLTQWTAIATRVDFADGFDTADQRLVVVGLTSVIAAGALATRPLRLITNVSGRQPSFWASVAWRALAYVVLIAGSAGLLVRMRFLGALPLGLLVGADAVLALWALGVAPRPLHWLYRFLMSTVHFGVLGALLATAIVESERVGSLLSLYVAMWAGAAVAVLTMRVIDVLSARNDLARIRESDAIRMQERAYRAHWLHDDVLSEVRLTTMRLGEGALDAGRTHRELRDLDHRLRLRQLDEVMRGGSTYVYEILQPHLRRAQAVGVQLVRVPSLESSGRLVDEAASRQINRVVSVVTSNAINAGATVLMVDLLEESDEVMSLTVTDDAGGFDLDSVPTGRGLDLLRRDLGTDAVSARRVGTGSAVTVRITAPVLIEGEMV